MGKVGINSRCGHQHDELAPPYNDGYQDIKTKQLLETTSSSPSETELLWRHYALHVDLYKHYLDLIVKYSIFHYGITGGILSFFFSQSQKTVLRYSLILPMVMSLFFFFLAYYSADQITRFVREFRQIRDKLGFRPENSPNLMFAAYMLRAFALFLFVTYVGIMLVFALIK